jgi:hypothetical protein
VHCAAWDDPASARSPRTTATAIVLNSLPPEFRPYLRRVAMLIVLAAALGVVLALVIPAGHHH